MFETTENGVVVEQNFSRREERDLPVLGAATPMTMLAVAVQRGMDAATIQGLMDLQDRFEEKEALKAFNVAFSAFKSEAVQIIKNRTVDTGPLNGKKYAELFAVVNAITPALSKHGLSSAWRLTKDEKEWIEVTCTIKHVLGHSESVSMGGPPDSGGAKSAIQARASTVSYLERYTLKAICGVSEQSDDNDGAGASGGLSDEEFQHWVAAIESKTTKSEAKEAWKAGMKACEFAKDVASANKLKDALLAHGKFIDDAAKG